VRRWENTPHHDPFFLPSGPEAFKRNDKNAEVRFYDSAHFALETRAAQIAADIREFLARTLPKRTLLKWRQPSRSIARRFTMNSKSSRPFHRCTGHLE
jgi:hypothetical protein